MIFRIFVIISFFLPLSLWAGLEWEKTELVLPVEADQQELIGTYRFKNTGSETVTIEMILSGCGCTVPELEKKVYAPGESGEIKVVFTIGKRTGHQRKVLSVVTDEANTQPTRLILETNIPELATIKPRMLLWRKGSEPEWKEVKIKTDPENEVSIPLQSLLTKVPYELIPNKDVPGDYTFRVNPVNTLEHLQVEFPISVTLPAGEVKNYKVYLLVR